MNVKIRFTGNILKIDSSKIEYKSLNIPLASSFRASYYLIPVMLNLFNKCEIALPGGCNIGTRAIDEHIELFKMAGYDVSIVDNALNLTFKNRVDNLNYSFKKKSVGASINGIILSLGFEEAMLGGLVIEPEAKDLIDFVKRMGYEIVCTGTEFISHGQKRIDDKVCHSIIPDRMEAMTYICLGLLYGRVVVKNVNSNDLRFILELLTQAGYKLKVKKHKVISFKSEGQCFNISTGAYPLFPTDLQPIFGVLNALGRGNCVIEENIFSSRMKIYDELNKMGASINVLENKAYITGVESLKSFECSASDLREGAALVLASIGCGGVIKNIDIVLRGYEALFYKLYCLGIRFKIQKETIKK